MAKHQWSILCKRSIIDKDDNSISLIDVIEELGILGQLSQDLADKSMSIARARKSTSMGLQLISLWVRSNRKKSEVDFARVQVKGPKGERLITQEYNIELNTSIRTRSKMHFPGIPYAGVGIYTYITQQKKGTKNKPRWTTVSELFLDLKEIDIESPVKTH